MITTRSFAVLGLCLAFGLAVFGVQVNRAVRRAREFDRYLTVRGASELEVKATLAIWPIRAAAFAEDLPGLKKSMEATRDIAVEFLRERGIPAEDINSGLPVVQDRHEIRTEDGHKISPRYKAVITLVVRSKKPDVVKQAIQQVDRLLDKGVSIVTSEYNDRADRPEFLFDGVNDVKPSMIAQATANARASAERFAHDSNARVGAIRQATQGVLEIEDRDVASPEIKKLRVVTTVEFFLE